MAMTIDNLRVDRRITVIQGFKDAAGVSMKAGETAVVRGLGFNSRRMEIELVLERPSGRINLVFPLQASTGPRNGHMAEFFAVDDEADAARAPRAKPPEAAKKMKLPPPLEHAPSGDSPRARAAHGTEGPDRLESVENELRASIDHIGVAASIAEVYANRMRAFQRAGNEPRAVAAFKLAVQWMASYAASATSGGEGAALSHEYDMFYAALVDELGYDPDKGT